MEFEFQIDYENMYINNALFDLDCQFLTGLTDFDCKCLTGLTNNKFSREKNYEEWGECLEIFSNFIGHDITWIILEYC
jgi:hypothetical protein